MKQFLFFFIAIFFVTNTEAQFSRYIVKFKNKATNPYSLSNPSNYLSTKAINRRTTYGIAIDSSDLPITPRYIDSVRLAGAVTILNSSKWLNQISIQTTDNAALTKINNLSFVKSVNAIAARTTLNVTNPTPQKNKFSSEEITAINLTNKTTATQDYYNYGITYNEIHLHNGEFLHNIGMRGQNMLVAVLDGGFFSYNTLNAFDSINANNQVLQTWDFVARESSVTEDDSHGMSCFSTIAGNIPGTFVGNAPKANFVLYRTEDAASEYPIEEHNWACGVERADSIGADIITSSLGYTTFDNISFDYSYASMNGNTTLSANAAKIANRKGILSFVSMGNDGNNSWKYLSTAADTDSLVSVGAVNTLGTVGNFSSYGPSFDGRVKPECSAVGVSAYVQNSNNTIGAGNGTSYATPKLAGLVTCLWQAFPEFNNIAIRDALIKSGSIYNTPNNRIGYGITDVKKAFILLLNNYANITSASINNCITTINFKSKDVSLMNYEIERLVPGQSTYTKIATINGSGTILSNKTYQFTDTLKNIVSGNIIYRIKQIIDTNTNSYSYTYFYSPTLILNNACYNNLPITLTKFSGINNNNVNTLNWTTSSETNNTGFKIQQSTDGIIFKDVNFITTKALNGNSNNSINYTYDDTLQNIGDYYYRLKSIDKNGHYFYSSIIKLQYQKTSNNYFTIVPNPTKNKCMVRFLLTDAIGKLNIRVADISGKILLQINTKKDFGISDFEVPTQHLAKGNYIIGIFDDNKMLAHQILIKL